MASNMHTIFSCMLAESCARCHVGAAPSHHHTTSDDTRHVFNRGWLELSLKLNKRDRIHRCSLPSSKAVSWFKPTVEIGHIPELASPPNLSHKVCSH